MNGARRALLIAMALVGGLRAQEATTRLEGLVLDPLSNPVANAKITVEVDGDVVARTQTDGLGTFVVGRVPARSVIVRAATAAPDVGATAIDLFAQPRGFARIHVMPARKVAGTVRDAAGKAIAAAWIVCAPTGNAAFGCVGSHTTSDANGAFALTHVPFGKVALRAWAPGLAAFAADIEGTANATIVCTLASEDVPQRTFELVDATPEQRAAARLDISVQANDTELLLPPQVRRPALAADGTWLVAGWPFDDVMLAQVELAGAWIDPARFAAGSTIPRRRLYVDDASDAVVQGRLTSGSGLPTGGVVLVARGLWVEKDSGTTVTTNADGTFALPTPVGRGQSFLLRCRDPGLALRNTQANEMAEPLRAGAHGKHTKTRVQEFPLLRARSVRFVVRDAEGLPFAGADVALLGAVRQEVTNSTFKGATIRYQRAPVFARGEGDVSGSVELTGLDLRDGELVVCQVAGPRGFFEQQITVSDGVIQDLGEVRVGPGASLQGRVLTADGKPMPGARLAVENWNGRERTNLVASDRSGAFRLVGMMPGACRITVLGRPIAQQATTLVLGETTEVTLQ